MNSLQRSWAFLGATVMASGISVWLYSTNAVARKSDAFMQLEVSRGHFSGAVLVSRDGKTLFERGYGLANAEWNIPNTPQTKFEIGSITKPFTAILIMQLERQGRLALSDPICKYLPDCPASWQQITLQQLISHTSGIFNLTSIGDFDLERTKPQTHEEMIARFRDVPLAFVPGEKFEYSNSNFYLLGLVIENVTGHSFSQVLQRQILDPLQMRSTGIVDRDSIIDERANGYFSNERNELQNNTRPMDPSWSFTAGAMYSTVEDLQKFDEALKTGALVPRETLERMWQPVKGTYGYGWQIPPVDRETLHHRVVEHGGRVPGFVGFFTRVVDNGVTVIALSNNISSNPARIVRGLSAIALGEPYVSSLTREPATVRPEILLRYAGSYDLDGKTWVVSVRNGRLFARYQRQPELEILPESSSTFFFRDVDGGMRAMEDGHGNVTGFLLTPGGQVVQRISGQR